MKRCLRTLLGSVAVIVASGHFSAAALGADLGSPGRATFGRPFAVSPLGVRVDDGGVAAVNASGRVVTAWTASRNPTPQTLATSVSVRIGTIDGHFGPVQTLAATGVRSNAGPLVAVGEDGTAVVAWVQETHGRYGRVRVSVAPPGARFGQPRIIGEGRFPALTAASVSATGRTAVAWEAGKVYKKTRIHLALGHGGDFASVLNGRTGRSASQLQALAEPDGAMVMTYDPGVPLAPTEAMELIELPATTDVPSKPVTVMGGTPFAGPGGLALGLQGDASSPLGVMVRSPAGAFGPRQPVGPYLGETESTVRQTLGPLIALPQGGGLSAAWTVNRALNGDNDDIIVASRVMAASQAPDGSFRAPQRLSRPGRLGEDPVLGAVGDTSVALWRENDPELSPPFSVAFATRPRGDEHFTLARSFTADGWVFPQVSSAGPNAVASWYPFNGYQARHERLMLTLWHTP